VKLLPRIDTPIEVDHSENGGILPYALRKLLPHTTSTHVLWSHPSWFARWWSKAGSIHTFRFTFGHVPTV